MALHDESLIEQQAYFTQQPTRESVQLHSAELDETEGSAGSIAAHIGEVGLSLLYFAEKNKDRPADVYEFRINELSPDKTTEQVRSKQMVMANGTLIYAPTFDGQPPVVNIKGLFAKTHPASSLNLTQEQKEKLGKIPTNINIPNYWAEGKVTTEADATAKVIGLERTFDLEHHVLTSHSVLCDDYGRIVEVEKIQFLPADQPHIPHMRLSVTPLYDGDVTVQLGIDGRVPEDAEDFYIDEAIASHPTDATIYYMTETTSGQWVALAQRLDVIAPEGELADVERTVVSQDKRHIAQNITLHNVQAGTTYDLVATTSVHSDVDEELLDGVGQAPLDACIADISHNNHITAALSKHIDAWNETWGQNNLTVFGDDSVEQSLKFNMGHVMADAGPVHQYEYAGSGAKIANEPARGYFGHWFWDEEEYAAAALTAQQLKAQFIRRHKQLPSARYKAEQAGFKGGWWPWEGHFAGSPVAEGEGCPERHYNSAGVLVDIKTLKEAVHISADIAHAAMEYYDQSGDEGFLENYAAEIVEEAARFMVSRATRNEKGEYIYENVTGPDEYHENVTNNAYTVLMAAHTMQLAKGLIERGFITISAEEEAEWTEVRENLYVPFDPDTLIFRAFDGWDELERIDLNSPEYKGEAFMDKRLQKERTPKNVPDDQLNEYQKNPVKGTQVIKQHDTTLALLRLGPNVLQFLPCQLVHDLVEKYGDQEAVMHAIYVANHTEYSAKISHGSSLSPASEVMMMLESGVSPDLAWQVYKEKVVFMDTRHNTHGTQNGLHTANAGESVRDIEQGFMNIKNVKGVLTINPRMPTGIGAERIKQFRGETVRIFVGKDHTVTHASLVNPTPGARVPVIINGIPKLLTASESSHTVRSVAKFVVA